MKCTAVIFDLDGVLVHTEPWHFKTWERLATQNDWEYSLEIAEKMKGKARMDSLETLLAYNGVLQDYTEEEKKYFCQTKNEHYLSLIEHLTPEDASPKVAELLAFLYNKKIPLALASSSRNAQLVLRQLQFSHYFSYVSDGNHAFASKPSPAMFLHCAEYLGVPPNQCMVIEDASSGVEAAKNAGMFCVCVEKNPLADIALSNSTELYEWMQDYWKSI